MTKRIFIITIFAITKFIIGCRQPKLAVETVQELSHYASGSGIAYFSNRIYLVGDDMSYLLIVDTNLIVSDSIRLLNQEVKRIPKDVKHDIESVSLLRIKRNPTLLLLGSGSLAPHRSKGWLIRLVDKERKLLELDTFYRRLLANGIKENNIEGVAAIPGGILLANRGNKSYPKNHLIFTSSNFWDSQTTADIRIMKLGANSDTASFSGVSGLDYSSKSDCLLLTISTENTYSAKADGSIGKSYLWLIKNFSAKRRMVAVNPDRIIDLDALDQRFTGHKIESLCIVSENRNEYHLVLAADDDNGSSLLFKITLKK